MKVSFVVPPDDLWRGTRPCVGTRVVMRRGGAPCGRPSWPYPGLVQKDPYNYGNWGPRGTPTRGPASHPHPPASLQWNDTDGKQRRAPARGPTPHLPYPRPYNDYGRG